MVLPFDVFGEAESEDRHAEFGHCVGGFTVDEAGVDWGGDDDDSGVVVLGFEDGEAGLDCAVEACSTTNTYVCYQRCLGGIRTYVVLWGDVLCCAHLQR